MSYDKVSLLLPMNGANNGTVFTDWSPVPVTVTPTSFVTSTAQFKYYDSSGYNAGSGQLSIANNTNHRFDADATFEAWIQPGFTGATRVICSRRGSGGSTGREWELFVQSTDKLRFLVYNSAGTAVCEIDSTTSITNGDWIHVAATRSSGVFRLFFNGVQEAAVTPSAFTYGAITQAMLIGNTVVTTGRNWVGYMQDMRFVYGEALYTANFTPPARLIGTISNSAVGASKILDINGDPAERTVIAVPRSYWAAGQASPRHWFAESNASGEFSIQAPAGVDHSVVAVADETGLRNDIVHRVIPV